MYEQLIQLSLVNIELSSKMVIALRNFRIVAHTVRGIQCSMVFFVGYEPCGKYKMF
jgi:hypothetical protein